MRISLLPFAISGGDVSVLLGKRFRLFRLSELYTPNKRGNVRLFSFRNTVFMSRSILLILFPMIAAGLCGLSIGQDVNQPKKKPAGTLEPTTISNAFTRFLPPDSTHASDIQTRIENSKPTAHGYARAYYEPDATYSDPGLKPLLSPFPRTQTPLTSNAIQTESKRERISQVEFEFGTIMTFPAIAEDASQLSNSPNFSLASTPLNQTSEVAKTSVIEITAGTATVTQLNQPNLFEIKVLNPSSQTATNIIVQMQISNNLMLTEFDRVSWIDEARRTVSWKIDSLESKSETIIRFRAQFNAIGRDSQQITAGMENQFQGQCELLTEVITPNNDKILGKAIRKN